MKKVKRQIIIVLAVGLALAVVVGVWEYQKAHTPITSLERGSYDGAEYQESLTAKTPKGEEVDVTVLVPKQEYKQSEIVEIFEAVNEKLSIEMLGDNKTLENIRSNMDLPTRLSDWPVRIDWRSNRPEIVDWQGEIGEQVSENGEEVRLTATISYQEERTEKTWVLKVFPRILSEEESRKQELTDAVAIQNVDTTSKIYNLPTEVDGEKIIWFLPNDSKVPMIVVIVIVLAAVILVGSKQEEVKAAQERRIQMQIDYPEILSKLILLMNAGMSMRMSFAKLASDYKKQKAASKQKHYCRYAYEEFLTTYQEMEHGVLEVKAYERLGNRCGLAMYKIFSVLLIQNLRKGNQKLLEAMEREMANAFEERKRRAKILGDQISTKLLLPMMMMLMIVFVLLMVPAFLSF